MTNITITYQGHLNTISRIEARKLNLGILELATTYKLSVSKIIYPLLRESLLGQIFSIFSSPANVKAEVGLKRLKLS